MDIIEFFRSEQKRLHRELYASVNGLTLDEWHYTLPGTGNHIAFILWHCVRTEDNILNLILRERPTLWHEEQWAARLQLPQKVQGTSMPTEEAHNLRLADPAHFLQYAQRVWQEFEGYLAGIDDGGKELSQRTVMVKPLGKMPAIQAIGIVCLSHLFSHLGEISLLLGAQGKQGSAI
ncbi:DinB family protein [Ktedonosporobacter rubrisoli]|uniref:DinB family protein n=1 Tax=Ktedonosporobacter rubrisoli TaxID=2509675 RepID=UPI0013EE8660|nr:DinB family protein [Ktedonosporobacter rubrisoli]